MGKYLRAEWVDAMIHVCLRKYQTVFQSGCTILHSHYQFIKFSILYILINIRCTQSL